MDERFDALLAAQTDLTGADLVEVERNEAGTVLWVNVEGVCVLRICRIGELKIKGEVQHREGAQL